MVGWQHGRQCVRRQWRATRDGTWAAYCRPHRSAARAPAAQRLRAPNLHLQGRHAYMPEHVDVDPHILSTPVIADIDGDGHDEIVVSVSHYFDRQ